MTAELHAQTVVSLLHQAYSDLKELSVIVNSKLHFFPNPHFFFFIFRENFTVIDYLYSNAPETAYFWKDRQFFVVKIKLSPAKLIQISVSSKKSFLDF